MWCCHCLKLYDVGDHTICAYEVWMAMSKEYSAARLAMQKQYDFDPKGETIDVRAPLTRSASQ